MRQIVLDTETTGLDPAQGHRIIEIGCVELVSRRPTGRTFHEYLQPDREIEAGAIDVHGITNEFLADKPRFADVAEDFIGFVSGAELVIHNAPFDIGFIDCELRLLGETRGKVSDICSVLDTLVMAREMHPGQKNSLDALCKRYEIDNSQRQYHGALLDAQILADVYLAMTGGQVGLLLGGEGRDGAESADSLRRVERDGLELRVVRPSAGELEAHRRRIADIEAASGGALWPLDG